MENRTMKEFIGEVFGGISAASDIAGVSFSDDFMYETGLISQKIDAKDQYTNEFVK